MQLPPPFRPGHARRRPGAGRARRLCQRGAGALSVDQDRGAGRRSLGRGPRARARARRAASPIAMPSSWSGDGRVAAGLIGYPLPDRPEPIPDTMPPMFVPLQELENLAPGTWYVNVLAAYPEHRGQGCGTALLAVAETAGRRRRQAAASASSSRTPTPAPAGSTSAAATARSARRGKVKEGWQNPGTDWVLLIKHTCRWDLARGDRERRRRKSAAMTDILDKITAYKLEEIADAQGRGGRWRPSRRPRAQAPPVRPFAAALEAQDRRRAVRADRRDQEGEPVQGPDPRRLRSAGAGQGLRGGRRGLPLRAHRRPLVPGRARAPDARRARPRSCRCCARTSCSTATRWRRRARWAPTASSSSWPPSTT